LLLANLFAKAPAQFQDTGGTLRSISINSAVSSPTIVFGSGTTAISPSDYQLQSPISGSSGSVAATVSGLTVSSTTCSFSLTCTVTNSSGGTLTYGEAGVTITVATFTFLILHDLVNGSVGQQLTNGQGANVTYTISLG
jgi:hypothetical protein